MPADTLTVSIPAPLAEGIRAAAEKRGLTPAEYVSQEMADSVAAEAFATDDLSWEEDYRRLNEAGDNIPLDEAFDRLDAKVAADRANAK